MQRQLWQQATRAAAQSMPVRRIACTQPIRAVTAAPPALVHRAPFNRTATAAVSFSSWSSFVRTAAATPRCVAPSASVFSALVLPPAAAASHKPILAVTAVAAVSRRMLSAATSTRVPAAAASSVAAIVTPDAAASSPLAVTAALTADAASGAAPSAVVSPLSSSPLPLPLQPPPSGLIFSLLPSWTHPYLLLARIDKPVGTWLLLLPCLWSLSLAASPGSMPDWQLAALLATGAFVMRGAGCTINDLWDRDFDARVERTKARPLAAGTISVPAALGFLVAQLLVGFAVALQLNLVALGVSIASLPLVVAYPLAKRYTRYPQLVLGLTFNWGVWVGYACVHGSVAAMMAALPQLLPFYLAGISWTLVYDTLYAHQDTVDDARIGLQSTALTFGAQSRGIMSALAATSVGMLAVGGVTNGLGVIYSSAVAGVALHYVWQLSQVDLAQRASCHRMFLANVWLGAILLAGIVIDRFCAKPEPATTNKHTDEQALPAAPAKPPTSWSVLRSYLGLSSSLDL